MDYKWIQGGVTAPAGFTAGGICCGVKPGNTTKLDLAMIYSDVPCSAAGIFTQNLVSAAPVKLTKQHLANGKLQAVIANSGNANCCNAEETQNALAMCECAASVLGIAKEEVAVASTGVIGEILPIASITGAIPALKDKLSQFGSEDAAKAIMTTDTVKKELAVEIALEGKPVKIGVIAKGSGMIHINMGTMLSFVTTDGAISAPMLQSALAQAAEDTYNMVYVDGDTSTNDTLVVLANGKAGNREITCKDSGYDAFVSGLQVLFKEIAKQLAADGEGATKLVVCTVSNSKTKADARAIARAVIGSSLVKTAMFGADANWGRVLCAIGYSGAQADVTKVEVSFVSAAGKLSVCKNGAGIFFSEELAKQILLEQEVEIQIDMHDGTGYAQAYGCDLTYDYVKINGDYRT